ncbi:hypothetical protein [Endozoicomonas euniceicola]|uniref:Uncharacterized protein n=1 Tax=Endozoicomonas euniceicola TaxID=1234143 RepID=A0ABY6GYR5_9GAMM|nr:hypothetical protein [Endozoicomonas euniceicola]UYM17201.1 hypothetical protein NX720_04560 [Endozoicomonas euniceicola]
MPTFTPAYNATSATTDSSSAELKLYKLCSGNLEGIERLTNEAMKKAAVKALERASANDPQPIDRCVIITPVRGNYINEAVDSFNNNNKKWEDSVGTAFLLVAAGMKSEIIKAGEDCSSKKAVIAGKQDGQASALPSDWLDLFQAKDGIQLKAGQKLIGVPLNSSNGSFAEGYFVGLQQKVVPNHQCSNGSYGAHYKSTFNKKVLIYFSGAGILVTGVTTLPAITQSYTEQFRGEQYCDRGSIVKTISGLAHDFYSEMLTGELNLKSMAVPENGYMVNITGNEFFQIIQPVIKIRLDRQSETGDSTLFSNRTLIGFSNNQVYSCYKGEVETPMDINIAYQDASPQPEFVQALEFKNNQILGDTPEALSLALPEHVTAEITSNEFITTKSQALKGISIAGPSQTSENWQNPLTVNITGNTLKGYQVALSLTGYQKLVLESNQLLADRVVIERRNDLTLPVTLAGDNRNQFKPGDYHPCYQLEDTNIIGGFVFSDGKTTCPKGFVAPTVRPPEFITPSFTTPVSQRSHQNNDTSTIALGSTPAMTTKTQSSLPDTTTRGIQDSPSKGDAAKTSYTEPKPTISTPIQPSGSQILPGSSKSRDSSFITPSPTTRRSSSTSAKGSHLSHHSDSSHSVGTSVGMFLSPTEQSPQPLKTARTTTMPVFSSHPLRNPPRHNSDSFIPGTTSKSHLSLKSTRGSIHKSFSDTPDSSYSPSVVKQVSSTKGFSPQSTPASKPSGFSQSLVTKTLSISSVSASTGYSQLSDNSYSQLSDNSYSQLSDNKGNENSEGTEDWQMGVGIAAGVIILLLGTIMGVMGARYKLKRSAIPRSWEALPLNDVQ